MAQFTFDNFGDLYRAAFAEQDPERKLFLLSEVRRAIAKWEEEIARNRQWWKGRSLQHRWRHFRRRKLLEASRLRN